MSDLQPARWIAFAGKKRLACDAPRQVAAQVKAHVTEHPDAAVAVFDAATSQPVDLDLRGSVAAVLRRIAPVDAGTAEVADGGEPCADTVRGPGRPKLGVVAREVTLLPRHWDWLASQPGGASVALRRLVEQARRSSRQADRLRQAQESAYRFMHVMAGNEPGFEEASRALFAHDAEQLRARVAKWPRDVRVHVLALFDAMSPTEQDALAAAAGSD